ncbi:MAG TPA: UDP-2,3-diacylglucosamine diphosphatase, partial [Casimicrobiaceae bacterium]|nr:UDP-2,3-diacylglucosamine diphosphatase [Casimicrobiaceae bacterium]
KPESILDVNAQAVDAAFRANGVTRIVHGHTHRPARHPSVVDGRACERIVLADWDDRGHYVAIDRDGIREYEIAA